MRILVTGATGYIGGRLVPALLAREHAVRCMARDPGRLSGHEWRGHVEAVAGDAFDPASLDAAMGGCDAVVYLIHSMDGGAPFSDRDRLAAANVRDAAARAGVERIVYLGGLGAEDDERLSPHLASRHEVGRVLADGPVPVIELRAAVIIGSGSVSFEMLRHLTEVLPVMVTPRWVRTRCQPVAVRDVLEALATAVEAAAAPVGHRIVEIGGPDVLTYEEMMQTYAEVAGLRRRVIVPVPLLTPRLSSRWVGLVTPLPVGVAVPIIESLRNEVVVRDPAPARDFLPEDPTPYRTAVERALERTNRLDVATRWSDALNTPAATLPTDPDWSGERVFRDRRTVESDAPAGSLFRAVSRIGGENGYYGMNWAWRIRGLLDTLVGGVGLRRGRRHPEELRPGESLDFWRVAAVEPGARLTLRAEMKVPGVAILDWTITDSDGRRTLTQEARFLPRGLWGRVYWWAMAPFHGPIFATMARRIVETAEGERQRPTTSTGTA